MARKEEKGLITYKNLFCKKAERLMVHKISIQKRVITWEGEEYLLRETFYAAGYQLKLKKIEAGTAYWVTRRLKRSPRSSELS